ncbi:MAG: NAD-dependent protein deacetylase [Myxococcales bacterium]|nr:NAD-dependent protein deacetylase [Myxococcales bacterium]MCB9552905.1 NAD-dependent protein deacetylase [Myxococcales bacterium]
MHHTPPPAVTPDPAPLAALLAPARRIVALTGAGLSTESGIPDYRSPRPTPPSQPIRYLEFVRDADRRRRYWARSMAGWPAIAAARPNAGHHALARLEAAGRLHATITQNVDRLHQRAGSARVIELHGALAEVRCLDCGATTDRDALQHRLRAHNPGWLRGAVDTLHPDGDAALARDDHDRFIVPDCQGCGGLLKPRVVFFGESVPPPRVAAAFAALAEADALLIAGTSLTVWSGLRFLRAAAERGIPIGLVNLGPVREGERAAVWIPGPTGQILPALVDRLLESAPVITPAAAASPPPG